MDLTTLKARLAIEEGVSHMAYLDTCGILTIGIGHNCQALPVIGVEKAGDRISDVLLHTLFEADVMEACEQLDAHLPWWKTLDDARQNVLIDLCFNMGINTLLTFHDTLNAIKVGAYFQAADCLKHSLWHKQVGNRAVWLENALKFGVY